MTSAFATPAHRSRLVRTAVDHAGARDVRVRTVRQGDQLLTTVSGAPAEWVAQVVTRSFPHWSVFVPADGGPAVVHSPADQDEVA